MDTETTINVPLDGSFRYAQSWLDRARRDFVAFRVFAALDEKNTKKSPRPRDGALAVYLLQQCIEKAVKSLVAASGKAVTYSHNSQLLISEFLADYVKKMNVIGSQKFVSHLGLDSSDGKFEELIETAKKHYRSSKDTFGVPAKDLSRILSGLHDIRSKIIENSRAIKKPLHELQRLFDGVDSMEDFTPSLHQEINSFFKKCAIFISEDQWGSIMRLVTSIGEKDDEVKGKKQGLIFAELIDSAYSGSLSIISLHLLSHITIQHENTSRYPSNISISRSSATEEIGWEQYMSESVGVVKHRGGLADATSKALIDVKDAIPYFCGLFSLSAKTKSIIEPLIPEFVSLVPPIKKAPDK